MKRRALAILALILFLLGVAVFFFSLVKGTNEYAFYAVILCAPGAALALFEYLLRKREREEDPPRDDTQL